MKDAKRKDGKPYFLAQFKTSDDLFSW